MVAFEPDFMNVQAKCVPEFTNELGMMAEWMAGMADAGKAMQPAPVPIQFCMATPYELLQSTQHSTVTNFRASNDFFYGQSFDIGASSLLIWALGAVPSKVLPHPVLSRCCAGSPVAQFKLFAALTPHHSASGHLLDDRQRCWRPDIHMRPTRRERYLEPHLRLRQERLPRRPQQPEPDTAHLAGCDEHGTGRLLGRHRPGEREHSAQSTYRPDTQPSTPPVSLGSADGLRV
jgi:hypothetical protein